MYVVPLTTITEQIAAGHALVAHESPAAAGEACQVLLALLAEGHLTRRLFGDMLRRIWALPVPRG